VQHEHARGSQQRLMRLNMKRKYSIIAVVAVVIVAALYLNLVAMFLLRSACCVKFWIRYLSGKAPSPDTISCQFANHSLPLLLLIAALHLLFLYSAACCYDPPWWRVTCDSSHHTRDAALARGGFIAAAVQLGPAVCAASALDQHKLLQQTLPWNHYTG
jgi:hypothetical protein